MFDRGKPNYDSLDGRAVGCRVCGRVSSQGDSGIGESRVNRDGSLYMTSYGRAVSTSVDPIEKKPLFHVAPGTSVLSVARKGCDFCRGAAIGSWDTVRWPSDVGNPSRRWGSVDPVASRWPAEPFFDVFDLRPRGFVRRVLVVDFQDSTDDFTTIPNCYSPRVKRG